MQITGEMLMNGTAVEGTGGAFAARNPASGEDLEPRFHESSLEQVDVACNVAEDAFDHYRAVPLEARAKFLEAVAQAIVDLGDALIERAMAESGLPRARLEGERGRTVGQLKMFADVVRQGLFLMPVLDSALPERAPIPRPDLRLRRIPLGPVAVFGASNFPLAFSVAGGDTASALASGCTVVVKAHPSHPGTSELVGRAVQQAVAMCGLPPGTFAMVCGPGNDIGEALASHPAIAALAFTGSRRGGLALAAIAAQREVPIPAYAEMSSVNPVFLLPGALEGDVAVLAQGLADSVTLGVGQFCTQPGLVFGIASQAFEAFSELLAEKMCAKAGSPMLNAGIHAAYERGLTAFAEHPGVLELARGAAGSAASDGVPALFRTTAAQFLADHRMAEELFGPSSLLVMCRDEAEMRAVASGLEGQLTATLRMTDGDTNLARALLPILERKAGRILVNGFPTGVEVSRAMVHGGPFPATTNDRTTSVGATAVDRFMRPVCYQNLPAVLLPQELMEANPLHLWRLRDGQLEQR